MNATETLTEIEEKVISIIADQANLDKEQVTMENTFRELPLDSLDDVEIIMSLEETFSIEIPDEDVDKIKTVADIANYVASRL
jgi:acyl carrier protein